MSTDAEQNRRHSHRHRASLAVVVQPVNSSRKNSGEALYAVSLDLSQGGVSFCCDYPLLTDLAIVSIQAAEMEFNVELLAKRVRCRRHGQLFEIAVQFIEKLMPEDAGQG